MARPDAAEVLKILRELGARLELDARAYGRTAENLSLRPIPLDQLIAEGRVKDIPGIGDALESVVTRLHETGEHAGLNATREKVPKRVRAMLRISGLKLDRIRKLHTDLCISSVATLEEAAHATNLKR
jgi:DNA polymerase (family 10)